MNFSNIEIKNAWKILISPERIDYSIDNLGPTIQAFETNNSFRKDFNFVNELGNKIECSIFIPVSPTSKNLEKKTLDAPCVIYCHSQSGNRVEGMFLHEFCIENGYGLCVFDFNSCGKSEGEYVTLGWREQDDLEQLINILTSKYKASQISVWGRSMGAVTAILYAKRNSMFLSSLVLDSPFSDIKVMVKDVAYEFLKLPGFIVTLALKYMNSKIEQKLKFNILKIKPINFVKECTVPCMFIIGEDDKLVLPKRAQAIFNAYGGKQKFLLTSKGDHSAERETHILNQSFNIIYGEFKKNSHLTRKTIVPRPNYADNINDDFLFTLGKKFEQQIEHNIRNSNTRKNFGNRIYSTSRNFNFDFCSEEDNMPEKKSIKFDEQMYLDYRRRDNTMDLEDIKPLEDFGDISQADLEKNLKDLSIVMRKQKF